MTAAPLPRCEHLWTLWCLSAVGLVFDWRVEICVHCYEKREMRP